LDLGTGKTVNSAAILQPYLISGGNSGTQTGDHPLFLYFFFKDDSSNDRTRKTAVIVASLIEQLFQANLDRKRLYSIIKRHYDEDGSSRCASIGRLWQMLSEMLQDHPTRIFIVLDALDECDDRHSESVVEHLTKLNARCLITSRPEKDIVESFSKDIDPEVQVRTIEMATMRDIETFITVELDRRPGLSSHKNAIIQRIRSVADGMFRYAALLLQELDSPSNESIEDILIALPKDLNEMYERLIGHLPCNPNYRKLRETTLMFISMAKRPVTAEEIAYANAVKLGDYEFDPSKKRLADEIEILKASGILIEVSDNRTFRFSHLTVKHFLLENPQFMLDNVKIGKGLESPLVFNPIVKLHACMAICTGAYGFLSRRIFY
jgi:hypothetical protein